MECMEARALKSSFTREIEMDPQHNFEDYTPICVTTTTGFSTDDFSVDEYFDLPTEEDNIEVDELFEEDEQEDKDLCFCSQEHVVDDSKDFTNFSTDLAIPVDDMQELELWSHLMDDNVQEPILACPKPNLDSYKTKTGFKFSNRFEPVCKPAYLKAPVITSAVPVKPRSKRSRANMNRSWMLSSSPKPESSSSSTSSPVSTLFFPPPVHEMGMFFNYWKPPMKKLKKKSAVALSVGENQLVQRRCSHCQVTKTPQWRAGPYGPKTLCNACGVRFKSGRLFPEYRPACSPTFSSEIHSNSHRKVLEMRKKKEGNEPLNGSPSTVLSC